MMQSFDELWEIAERIGGHLPHGDGHALYRACAIAHNNDPGCRLPWLEVGSFIGRSANIVAAFGHFTYLIDPHYLWQTWTEHADGGPDNAFRYTEKAVDETVKGMLAANTAGLPVEILSCESSEAKINSPIGFVFIDGNHTEGGVDVDASIWLPKLVDGGVAAFHDYNIPNYPLVTYVADVWTRGWECIVPGGPVAAWRKP